MDAKDMNEFKQTAEQLGKAAVDLQATNDQTTKAVGEVQVELKRVNDKVTELESIKSRLEAVEKQKGRPGFGGDNGQDSEYKNDFVAGFMRKGDEAAIQVKSGNTGVDADGGFAVPTDMDQSITQLLGKETPMRSECRVITVGNQGYKKLANLGGAASGWVGETDARPETGNPKLAQIAPTFGELYANPAATQVMLDDAMFNVEDWFNQEVVIEFSEQENSAFTSGDGVGKPKGILAHTMAATGDDARAFGSLQQLLSGNASSITSDNVYKLIYALRSKYRNGAKFMANNTSIEALRTMKDANGNYLWRPGLEMGQPSTLAGYGLVENEDMPSIAANAMPLMFGNFMRGYTIVDVQGVRTLRDPYTNKPFVQFYTTKRVGGMLEDSNAIKTLKVAA